MRKKKPTSYSLAVVSIEKAGNGLGMRTKAEVRTPRLSKRL